MKLFAIFAMILALAGCQKPATNGAYSDRAADVALMKPAAAPALKPAPLAMNVPQLAYDYKYGIEASARRIRLLVDRHIAECVAAGLQVCQMTGSNLDSTAKDQLHATLSLRATPQWIAAFRPKLMNDATAEGGETAASDGHLRGFVPPDRRHRSGDQGKDRTS